MDLVYLIIASIFEIGWPFGIKMIYATDNKIFWAIFAIITMVLSGYFLFLAQKHIPIGISYAIWTGFGMIGTFLIGVFVFKDAISLMKILGVFLIFSGVLILKFS